MLRKKISKIKNFIIIFLLPIYALTIYSECLGQEIKDEIHAENIKWNLKNETILVTYDLSGSSDQEFKLDITMRRESDPEFRITPTTVEGDIGKGFFSGTNKEIRWYYRRDFPQGLQGDDYYFEFKVSKLAKQNNLLYYIAGGVAVTAGIVALLAGKNPSAPPPHELPFPPMRP
jgi:hypothetical protein